MNSNSSYQHADLRGYNRLAMGFEQDPSGQAIYRPREGNFYDSMKDEHEYIDQDDTDQNDEEGEVVQEDDDNASLTYNMNVFPTHPGMAKLSRLLTDDAIETVCHNILLHMRDNISNFHFSNTGGDKSTCKKPRLEDDSMRSSGGGNSDHNSNSNNSNSNSNNNSNSNANNTNRSNNTSNDDANNDSNDNTDTVTNNSHNVLKQPEVISIITEFGRSCDNEVSKLKL
jgi:hypothetical protein